MDPQLGTSPDSVSNLSLCRREGRNGPSALELAERTSKLQKLLRESSIDCILLTGANNFLYFTGLKSSFWYSPTRSFFLVINSQIGSTPRAVVPSIMQEVFSDTWIGRDSVTILEEESPGRVDVRSLINAITTTGKASGGTLGLMMGFESNIRMPIKDLDYVRHDLYQRNWKCVDASALVRKLRGIKSDWEQAMMKETCLVASRAFEALPREAEHFFTRHSCLTERDLQKIMRVLLLENGADEAPYVLVQSGQNGYSNLIMESTDRRLCVGDIVIIDVGCRINGYWADFDRNFVIGGEENLDPLVNIAQNLLWNATEAGFTEASHHTTASKIFIEMKKILETGNTTTTFSTGRMGHGLGLDLTEQFSIVENDHTPIVPGMVITLEPGLPLPRRKLLVHEENVLITPEGSEWLSKRAPIKMATILLRGDRESPPIHPWEYVRS